MITKDEVRYVAALARIHLKDNELDSLSEDLDKILEYIDQLNELDVQEVPPTSHVLPLKNVHREDQVRESLPHASALSFAVQKDKGAFKVPKVIE